MKGDFFMKKLLIIIAVVISVGVLNKSKNESVVIPSSSIRFRVVSNSNAPGDIKNKLNLTSDIYFHFIDEGTIKGKKEAYKIKGQFAARQTPFIGLFKKDKVLYLLCVLY